MVESKPKTDLTLIPGGKGKAVRMNKGDTIKIINTHGTQVCCPDHLHASSSLHVLTLYTQNALLSCSSTAWCCMCHSSTWDAGIHALAFLFHQVVPARRMHVPKLACVRIWTRHCRPVICNRCIV